MRLKIVITLITALLFNAVASGPLAYLTGWDHLAVFGGMTVLSALPLAPKGAMLAGLNKEIWLPEIIEKFYPSTSLLSYCKNLDAWVDNNALNLQEAGIDPKVYIDNAVWPIPISVRKDAHHQLPLKRFDTENTVHRDAIEVEESAEKRQSVIEGHKKSLLMKFTALAAFNWAPQKETATTPVVETTSTKVNKRGFKAMSYEDILEMELRFNELEVPEDERVLALHHIHASDLMLQDLQLYKTIWNENKLFSFKVVRCSQTPKYLTTTKQKTAFEAASTNNDVPASLAYHEGSVGRCQGDMDMYFRLKDPEHRGDIIGFNMRGMALPITGKYIGAFISGKN